MLLLLHTTQGHLKLLQVSYDNNHIVTVATVAS